MILIKNLTPITQSFNGKIYEIWPEDEKLRFYFQYIIKIISKILFSLKINFPKLSFKPFQYYPKISPVNKKLKMVDEEKILENLNENINQIKQLNSK